MKNISNLAKFMNKLTNHANELFCKPDSEEYMCITINPCDTFLQVFLSKWDKDNFKSENFNCPVFENSSFRKCLLELQTWMINESVKLKFEKQLQEAKKEVKDLKSELKMFDKVVTAAIDGSGLLMAVETFIKERAEKNNQTTKTAGGPFYVALTSIFQYQIRRQDGQIVDEIVYDEFDNEKDAKIVCEQFNQDWLKENK